MSDLEHLVSLADMMGGHVRMSSSARRWYICVRMDGSDRLLASVDAPTITGAVLACLAKLRTKETTDAK